MKNLVVTVKFCDSNRVFVHHRSLDILIVNEGSYQGQCVVVEVLSFMLNTCNLSLDRAFFVSIVHIT